MPRFVLLAAVSLSVISTASAETLQDALVAAYNSNPSLQSQRAELRATDEDVATAKSGYRPSVAGSTSVDEGLIDQDGTSFTTGVNVQQPLFRGGRTRNQVSAAELGVKIGREQLRGTENSIFLTTVSAYMDVVRDQAVLDLNDNQVKVLERQLQATRDRFRVGEITRTDVAQSEARLAGAVSGRIAAAGGLVTSREAYRRVVGQLPGTLETPSILPNFPKTVDEAVDIALQSNPEVLAARFAEKVADKQVSIAKGAVLPSAAATAGVNYIDQPNVLVNAPRSKVTAGSVGATVSIPLFQSGAEYAAVRKAQQLRSQRMIDIAVSERRVVEQVRNAWALLETSRASIESSRSAVRANEIALEGVRQEQTVGTRTVLDVLDAEQELLNTRVELVRSQRNELVAAHGVIAAVGQLDAASLNLPVDRYNPDDHYNKTRNRWIGWDNQN